LNICFLRFIYPRGDATQFSLSSHTHLCASRAPSADRPTTPGARPQVRDEFFNLIDRMVDRLYHRGQDPDDKGVDASFIWRTWADIPAANIYNMDEVGCDTNKGRKKKVGHVDTAHDGLKRCMEVTDGDNNPFHVTNCMTTRADGATPIPPYIGHANPGTKSKADTPNIMPKHIDRQSSIRRSRRRAASCAAGGRAATRRSSRSATWSP
jgi:hypothetical protein